MQNAPAKPSWLNPLREGERIYRSGDFGRWSPDRKLEFLGRQDAQVKIRGFRIEIGDIENALLRVDGVSSGAVVINEHANGNKQLIAFYSGANHTAVCADGGYAGARATRIYGAFSISLAGDIATHRQR